jgi:hypothetical protein
MSDWDKPCAWCGADPAVGFATFGESRLCHGDDQRPSCYELATNPYLRAASGDKATAMKLEEILRRMAGTYPGFDAQEATYGT